MTSPSPSSSTAGLAITCIAFIGKNNNPLYIRNFTTGQHDLKYHYIAHTCCDVIEERVNSGVKHSDLYLGLLYTMENLSVYGYYTNTKLKIILMSTLQDAVLKDADIKSLLKKLHTAYVNYVVSNPFFDIDAHGNRMITGKAFVRAVEEIGRGSAGANTANTANTNTMASLISETSNLSITNQSAMNISVPVRSDSAPLPPVPVSNSGVEISVTSSSTNDANVNNTTFIQMG